MPTPMTSLDERSGTLTNSIYESLRNDILSGRYRPGERLSADGLRKHFVSGASPIREALNRLLAENLVSQEEQKGFRVAAVSRSALRELVKTRCWVDGRAIAESIARYERDWEEGLVLALHRLSRERRPGPNEERPLRNIWESVHRDFHAALVSGCGSRWMRAISMQLFDAAERYRLLAMAHVPERNELDEHQAIVEACLNRDEAKASQTLEYHYGRTLDAIAPLIDE